MGLHAEMNKRKKTSEQNQNRADDARQKRGRGRPTEVRPPEIRGRADNYRAILQNVWPRFWPSLSEAQSEKGVIAALQNARPYDQEFSPWASLILSIIKERNFPRTQRGQVNFLADSLGALGQVSPRRSRDICAAERLKLKRAHHILRYEFYVECSCGFKGHSLDHACPECGAKIKFGIGSALGPTLT
jgi:hypothetical protein